MNKVLIYSIAPEHMVNILNGKKSVEVRKRDLPQWALDIIKSGGVVEGYGYCTMGKPILSNYYNSIGGNYTLHSDYSEHFLGSKETQCPYILNGKVVVKFQVSGVTQFEFVENNLTVKYDNEAQLLGKVYMLNEQATQLTYEQLFKYIGNNNGYAHHLTNIQPIEPMEIKEFYSDDVLLDNKDVANLVRKFGDTALNSIERLYDTLRIKRAPQSFMTAWVKGE